jgi:hypothetical protein
MDFSVAEKFVQEIVWRTYWKGSLDRNPSLWISYQQRVEQLKGADLAAPWRSLYEAACAGKTHLSYFNQWVEELIATGYLHNHIRMWFASIWVFTFRIPWQLGAAFMYHHLLDGDPASNTLSWRWVAGLHTKGKTYLARADNIAKYSQGRWSPDEGDLATAPAHIEDDSPLMDQERLSVAPLSPTSSTGLLVTTDDLSIDSLLDLSRYRSVRIFNPYERNLTPGKQAFVKECIQDFAARITTTCGEGVALPLTSSGEVMSWQEAEGVDAIQIVAPQVGPLGTAVQELLPSLIKARVSFGFLQRSWDSTLFPLCDKGFFTMWERFKKRWAHRSELTGTCSRIAL